MTRVLTTGVYDLFHVGHLRSLQKASTMGDYLIVGVVPDELAASYKRPPVIPFDQRWEIVEHIACVDEVIVDECIYPVEFYQRHRIDITAKAVKFRDTTFMPWLVSREY